MGTPRPELSIRSRAFNVNPEEERIAPPQQRRRGDRRQPHGSLLTRRWREVDSNHQSPVREKVISVSRTGSGSCRRQQAISRL